MKRILVSLALVFSVMAQAVPLASLTMLSAQTTTVTSDSFGFSDGGKTFQAKGTTSAGSGAATIKIEGSNVSSTVDGDWVLLCTITLTLGTTSTGDGCAAEANWRYHRARITAISGTTATVSVYMAAAAK